MGKLNSILLAVGAALPDLDYPKSFIGRLLPFVSVPMAKTWGHRKELHGYPFWCLVALGGAFFEPLLFLGLGRLKAEVLTLKETNKDILSGAFRTLTSIRNERLKS